MNMMETIFSENEKITVELIDTEFTVQYWLQNFSDGDDDDDCFIHVHSWLHGMSVHNCQIGIFEDVPDTFLSSENTMKLSLVPAVPIRTDICWLFQIVYLNILCKQVFLCIQHAISNCKLFNRYNCQFERNKNIYNVALFSVFFFG